jgi:periplasmic mercuric ion binding protein
MKKSLLSAFAIIAFTFTGWAIIETGPSAEATPSSAADVANYETLTFNIENMTCATCPITVKKSMKKVEGVKDVGVDFEAKTATVKFDPAVTSAQEIGAASTNAGYPATVADAT